MIEHFDLFGNQVVGTDTRVDAFGDAWLVVNNVRFDGPVMLGSRLMLRWNARSPAELTRDDFVLLTVLRPLPEILVIGTGDQLRPLDPGLRSYIRSLGVTVDVMTTPHASATFNVLVQEGRLALAGLFPLRMPPKAP